MPIKDGSDPARDRGGVVHRRQRERMAGGHKVAPADGEEEESGVTRSAREAVEQAKPGIHRDTADLDQLLIFRRVVPIERRFMVRKPHECP